MKAWEPCEMCGDFICTIHEEHAADCTCPAIEVWCEHGMIPYDAEVTPSLRAWVEAHPYQDD